MRTFIVVWLNISVILIPAVNSYGGPRVEDLLLYWGCDEGNGNQLMDFSGNGWNANIKAGKSRWVNGKFGGGIRLQQAYAQVDGNIIESIGKTGEITIMLWFRMNEHTDLDGIISIKPPEGKCCPYRLMVNSNSNPLWNVGNPVDKSLPSFTFELNRWYHYALTVDKDSSEIYVDGKLVGEQAENSDLPAFKEVTIYLGTGENPGTHPVEDSTFDEVMIWDQVLSENEVADIAWNGLGHEMQVVTPEDKLTKTWGSIKLE